MAEPELLNVRETARRLGVPENTVRNWERRGLLRAVRLRASGFRRFDAEAGGPDLEGNDLAPADEGPVVEPRLPVRGTIVQGDLSWKSSIDRERGSRRS